MIPTSFRAADVIERLVTVARTTFPKLLVIDGPRTAQDLGTEVLVVGADPEAPTAVIAQRSEADMDGRSVETGQVACYLVVIDGSGRMATARARAMELLTDYEAAIRADGAHPIDDVAYVFDELNLGPDMALLQWQTREGAQAAVPFTASYVAYV